MPADAKTSSPPLADGDRAIPLLEGFAALGAASPTTGYARIKSELGFPQPFWIGRRRFFLQSEILAHLSRLAAQRSPAVQP